MLLDPIQVRVLGSLIEKEIATPENYPLSLNALVNACNQKSSRDPVLDLTEDHVRQALHILEDLDLVSTAHDARVPKYEHRIRTVLNLRRDETAVLCLLLLRGSQTPGELRSRSERLFAFDDLAAVQSTLDRLASREPADEANPAATGPLVALLPRQPGSREARYTHLLSEVSDVSASLPRNLAPSLGSPAQAERIASLESEIARLSETVQALESRLAQLEQNLSIQASSPEEPPATTG